MGILDSIFGNNNNNAAGKFLQTLTENDFTTTDHQTVSSTTDWTTIATYQCPAQQRIAVGWGDINHPDSAGRIYAYIRTGEGTPAEITGKLRILVTNYNDTKRYVLFEGDESHLHGDVNDITKKEVLVEKRPLIGEDSYIKVQIKPVAAHETSGAGNDNVGWADTTESLLRVPITVYQ